MHTWILILTLTITANYHDGGSGVNVQSVDGFTSVQSCLAAGNQWLAQTKSLDTNTNSYIRARALCVQK